MTFENATASTFPTTLQRMIKIGDNFLYKFLTLTGKKLKENLGECDIKLQLPRKGAIYSLSMAMYDRPVTYAGMPITLITVEKTETKKTSLDSLYIVRYYAHINRFNPEKIATALKLAGLPADNIPVELRTDPDLPASITKISGISETTEEKKQAKSQAINAFKALLAE